MDRIDLAAVRSFVRCFSGSAMLIWLVFVRVLVFLLSGSLEVFFLSMGWFIAPAARI
ncbi:Uncharacterized protein APZ42_004691 [Daphnia magna]|uniref:Uncharacterized protein n=1 Tax=Daphnia magna TaxID=35525 RepID=A0A162CUN5_9CRUS|nr:Uncharacterized protein APZ42_004691 [Daphnia magna]